HIGISTLKSQQATASASSEEEEGQEDDQSNAADDEDAEEVTHDEYLLLLDELIESIFDNSSNMPPMTLFLRELYEISTFFINHFHQDGYYYYLTVLLPLAKSLFEEKLDICKNESYKLLLPVLFLVKKQDFLCSLMPIIKSMLEDSINDDLKNEACNVLLEV